MVWAALRDGAWHAGEVGASARTTGAQLPLLVPKRRKGDTFGLGLSGWLLPCFVPYGLELSRSVKPSRSALRQQHMLQPAQNLWQTSRWREAVQRFAECSAELWVANCGTVGSGDDRAFSW